MLRAAVFDMDGLLLDTERVYTRCWMEAGREAGVRLTEEGIYQTLGLTDRDSYPFFRDMAGGDFDFPSLYARQRALAEAEILGHVSLMPSAVQALDAAGRRGLALAVASSSKLGWVKACLDRAGILDRFDALLAGDMFEHSKPAPDIYLAACRALGVEPDRAVALEDASMGVKSAHAAGMRVIMVYDILRPTPEDRARCFACVPSLADVPELFDRLMAN